MAEDIGGRESSNMEYIRRIWSEIKEEKIWFVILTCTELVSLFFLWLSGMEQFKVLAGLETSCFVIIFLKILKRREYYVIVNRLEKICEP